jgi:hypothetical protein
MILRVFGIKYGAISSDSLTWISLDSLNCRTQVDRSGQERRGRQEETTMPRRSKPTSVMSSRRVTLVKIEAV